jgi:hypothetical protein
MKVESPHQASRISITFSIGLVGAALAMAAEEARRMEAEKRMLVGVAVIENQGGSYLVR